jgi:O-antigen/teichoic acid export membrane protein
VSVTVTAPFSSITEHLGSHVREYGGTFATEFTVLACQLLTYKLAAHFLGKTGFAEYAVARRTISILYPIVLLGLGVGLPRYIANAAGRGNEESKTRYLGAALSCVGLSALVCVILLNAFGSSLAFLFFGSREYTSLILPLSLVVAGTALHAIVYSYFRGILYMRAANLLQFLNFGLVPVAVFLFYSNSVQSLLTALGLLSFGVAAGALLITPWKTVKHANRAEVKELLRFGIQRVPGDFILMALFALPATFIAHKSGIRAAGYVAFGISMLNVIGSFFSPFGLILLPKAGSLLAAGRNGELKRQVWLLARITLVVSVVLALGIAIGAERLLRLYLGPDFTEGAGILRLLLIAAVPYSLYMVLRNVIDAFHELGVTTMILAAGFGIFCFGSSGIFSLQDKLHVVLLSFLCGMMTICLLSIGEALRILRRDVPNTI